MRRSTPELGHLTISLIRVKSSLLYAAGHRGMPKFSLRRLKDMSTYVSEYRRYALAVER